YSVEGSKKTDKRLLVTLKYKVKQSAIVGIKRVSKPDLRVYVKSEEIPKVLRGYGSCIMSTSKGLMNDKEERKANVGGEIIAFIW
ncbi:30S ribosomal protein S8, partial [Mycoplasmopsis synoviae]